MLLLQIRELIYKRGFAKVNKQRLPISENSVIEQVGGRIWPILLAWGIDRRGGGPADSTHRFTPSSPPSHARRPHHLKTLQELGKYGIICVEDLIHEIYTCGPHFKQVRDISFFPGVC